MGVDIHMQVFKDNKIYAEEIFDGRNSDWFANLAGNGWDKEYDYLPTEWGIPENCPDKYKEIYTNAKENCYYDFRYFRVKDFVDWFEKYKPNLKAGWASIYEEWAYKTKGICPEELPISKPEDNDVYVFIEYENKWDCSKWLYDYIKENNLSDEDIIFFYFDC